MDYRPNILDALLTLKKRELAQKAPFKARAYDTVLRHIEQLSGPIRSMEDLTGIKGMGDKIREKLEEIFATGQLRTAEKAKELYSLDAHDALQGIYGIGPAKATELIQQGITSIAALRQAAKDNPAILNDKQRIGLHYYEDLVQRIPFNEMVEHERLLLSDCPLEAELVGSFRRRAATSGDIDVLIRVMPHQTPQEARSMFYSFVQRLSDRGYIKAVLALGEHKCMAICSLGADMPARRLDLLLTPDKEYPFALLYFTGSDRFNVAVRQHALTRGYTLNEHRMSRVTPVVPSELGEHLLVAPIPVMRTEEDILHFLELEYVPPTERVDATSLQSWMRPLPPSPPSLPSPSPLRMRRPKPATVTKI